MKNETISCPTCSTLNSSLNAKCTKCGSFLQARVANLNLFETIWQIIESPASTFRKICLSEQKNYVYALFGLFGIGLAFNTFRFISLGNILPNLLRLIIIGLFAGPFAGIITMLLLNIFLLVFSKYIFRSHGKFRNIISVTAYSLSPIILSIVFILPVELIVFGLFLFTNNPSPQMLKPVPFYVLISLDAIAVLYSMILFTIGIRIANSMKLFKSILLSLLTLIIFLFGLYLIFIFIKHIV